MTFTFATIKEDQTSEQKFLGNTPTAIDVELISGVKQYVLLTVYNPNGRIVTRLEKDNIIALQSALSKALGVIG